MLKGRRYKAGLTQKALAEQIGVKPHHISEMEHEKRPIGKNMAQRLAKIFGVDYRIFL
jgi:plasmid maintenance system antidote protein VapI